MNPDVPVPPAPQPPRPRGKVFDVQRPGKAPASPTSRPVVIGHKPGAQAAQVTVSGIGSPASLMDSSKKIDVQPDFTADPMPATPNVPKKTNVPITDAPTAPERPAPAPANDPMDNAPELAPRTIDEPGPTAASAPASAPKSVETSPPEHDKLSEAALEPDPPAPTPRTEEHPTIPPLPELPHDPLHDAAPPSLEGQVVVSHHTTAPAGTLKLVGLIVLVVVFVVLVMDILLDAGVLSTTVIPHTHFF